MRIVYLMTTIDNDSIDSDGDDDAVEHNFGMTLLGSPNWAKEQIRAHQYKINIIFRTQFQEDIQ